MDLNFYLIGKHQRSGLQLHQNAGEFRDTAQAAKSSVYK